MDICTAVMAFQWLSFVRTICLLISSLGHFWLICSWTWMHYMKLFHHKGCLWTGHPHNGANPYLSSLLMQSKVAFYDGILHLVLVQMPDGSYFKHALWGGCWEYARQVVHQAKWVYLFTEGYKLYENAGSCQGCDGPTSDAFDLCIAGGFGYSNYATPTVVM